MEEEKRTKLVEFLNRLKDEVVRIFNAEGGLTIADLEAVLADLPAALKQDLPISFVQTGPQQ